MGSGNGLSGLYFQISDQITAVFPHTQGTHICFALVLLLLFIKNFFISLWKKIQVKHACKKFLASAIDMVDEHLSDEYGSRAISSDGHSFEVLNEALSFFHVTLAFQG